MLEDTDDWTTGRRTGVRYEKRPVDTHEVQYTDLGPTYCFSLKARAAELSLSVSAVFG